ncbi:hypothetical protein [Streptosporangium carneum]|uniref:hypothetical protein n=1 Tax=Streptosporangium carneum TaxID=47481 RepID=UPI0031E85372
MVLTAIVLLIAGFVLAKPFLVMWSIAVSVLSAVFLVIGALLRRHELFPGGGRAGAAPPFPQKGPVPQGPPTTQNQPPAAQAPQTTAPYGVRQTAPVAPQPPLGRPEAGPSGPVPAARRGPLDDEAIVLVIPGRKRYHVAGCRQLAGRDHEELTHEEAREEGFTPCTTCLPEFTAGIQQSASPEAQEPAVPSPQGPGLPRTASQEPGPSRPGESGSGDAGESGVQEPTARFASPYAPVTAPGDQDAPVTRPYVQGSPAPGEQSRPRGNEQSPAGRATTPPLRAAEPATAFPVRFPVPEPETPADANATSWFSRDLAASLASGGEPAQPGAEPSAKERAAAGAAPEESPDKPVKPVKAASPATVDEPAEAGPRTGDARPETKPGSDADPRADAPAGQKTPAPSSAKQAAPAGPAAEPARTAEPVESAETGPGRAGRPAPVGSTSANPARPAPSGDRPAPSAAKKPSDGDDEGAETNPRGIPAVKDQPAGGSETVRIISGTRRFHSPDCPLIKGLDAIKGLEGSGLESMPLAEAEKAGMRSCSVCRPGS